MQPVAAETMLGAMEFLVATSKTSGCDPFAQLDNTSRLAKIKEPGKDDQPNSTHHTMTGRKLEAVGPGSRYL